MQIRTSLLASAAVGVLLAVSVSAAAEAKTAKHHAAGAENLTAEQLQGLSAEVEDLKARLQAESDARAKDEAAVKAAQDDAAAARAEAQAAHQQVQAQIQTLPGEVKSAVAANKPKPSWADSTSVSGRVYANISQISQSPSPNAKNGTGFDVKRAYLGVDHKFNDIYSANLTIDFAANPNGNGNNANGVAGTTAATYIKKAYVQAKFSDMLTLRGGAADMPWIPFAEDMYGYRYVEKTITDTYSFGNSADWGVFALGKFYGGLLNYSVAAVDGGGYKNPARSKSMDFEGRFNVNYHDFTVAVGGYSGKLDKNIQGGTPTTHTANRFDVLAAYSGKQFRIGGEYFTSDNWKRVTSATADKTDGYSIFGNFNFTPQISAFARYDWLKPSKDLAPTAKADYYNIGISYEPTKVVDFALVYKHDHLNGASGSTITDANTTMTVPVGGASPKYDEFGIFTQFRF